MEYCKVLQISYPDIRVCILYFSNYFLSFPGDQEETEEVKEWRKETETKVSAQQNGV